MMFDREITSEKGRRKFKNSIVKTLRKYNTVHAEMAERGVVQHGECERTPENDAQNSEKYEEAKTEREVFLQKEKEFNFLHQKIKIIVKRLKDYEDAMAVAKMNKLDEPRASQD